MNDVGIIWDYRFLRVVPCFTSFNVVRPQVSDIFSCFTSLQMPRY